MSQHLKKLAGFALTAGLILSGGTAVASPAAEALAPICWPAGIAVKKTTIYDKSSTNGTVLGTIPKGGSYQSCSNYGHTNYASWPYWIEVSYNGTKGWVRVDYLYGSYTGSR